MISLYFGLPRCGKTTLLARFASRSCRKGITVYGNIPLAVPNYIYIDNSCIGKYMLQDCLILIDEGTLFANSRNYKTFSDELTSFFLLHGHYRADIIIFTQQWDGLDKRIRVITDKVYYVYKPPILGRWITRFYRVPYGIIIPDPKKSDSEKLGEIVQGYCKPSFFQRVLFGGRIFRPRYYKYFDSWDAPELPPLPEQYQPWRSPIPSSNPTDSNWPFQPPLA